MAHEPEPAYDPGGAPIWTAQQLPTGAWHAARKTALTPVIRVAGPCTIVTTGGQRCPLTPAFDGYLAVDQTGHPYPLAADVFEASYETVRTINDPAEVLD